MTENAQVDKENNWALLHGHFLKVDCNVLKERREREEEEEKRKRRKWQERGSNLRRQRLASPPAQMLVAQTTRPLQKKRLRDEL